MMNQASSCCMMFIIMLFLFARCECLRPVLPNDPLHMYYGELNVCNLRDGVTPKTLITVPASGEDTVNPLAVAEAPEMQFVVVDGELLTVIVRSPSGHLPPFRVVISPAEDEEDAESAAIFSVASQHSLSKPRVEFAIRPSLQLRFMHAACLQFIRLDTYSRRLSTFEYQLPKYIALTSAGKEVVYLPHNASMGIRFRVLLDTSGKAWRMRITALRKPPIPPLIIRVYMKLCESCRGEYLLGAFHEDNPGPRGATFEDALATVPPAQMDNMIIKRDDMVFLLRVDFEELHRQCYEEYRMIHYVEEMKRLTEYHQMEKVLFPTAASDRTFGARHCTADGKRSADVRSSDLVRLRLFFSAHTQSVAFHIVQPFPMSNLQIHALDGLNDTIVLEEEHYVPFISMHDGEATPFGWHYVLDKNATWIRGDTLTVHLFFDMRMLPAADHAIARGASAVLHPGIRSRVTMQDRHDSLVRWVQLHGGSFLGSVAVNHQQQKCWLQMPSRQFVKGNLVASIPRELLFSEVQARAIPFIRQLFASDQWGEFVEDQQSGGMIAQRDVQVLILTLFSLTQAESPTEGTKWHVLVSALPSVGPNGLTSGIGLNVAQHHSFVAETLDVNQLRGVADVVRKRRALLDDMFKFLSSQWPWLIEHTTQAPVSKEQFIERFAAIDSVAVLSSNGVLYVPPLIHECTFSDNPITTLVFNSQNDSVELRFARSAVLLGQSSGDESMEVTCDLIGDSFDAVESFLRRGFIPLRAASVVDISLREAMLTATGWIPNGEDTFFLSKKKGSRDAVLTRLSEFAAECRLVHSPQCLRLFRHVVERRLAEFPASTLSQRVVVRSDADRLVASHVSAAAARLVRGARDVLLTHLDYLTDEAIDSSEAVEQQHRHVEPSTSISADM